MARLEPSLKQSLLGLMALAIGIGLLTFLAASAWVQAARHRDTIVSRLDAIADAVANDPRGALVFRDEQAARSMLASIDVRAASGGVRLVGPDGRPFAGPSAAASLPAVALQPDEARQVSGSPWQQRMQLVRTILADGQPVGAVVVEADMSEPRQALVTDLARLGLGGLIAFTLAFGLALRLQRSISTPVRALAEALHRLVRDRDHHLRVVPEGAIGEIATLAQGFNALLAEIELRDRALGEHRDRLEEQVDRRSTELRVAKERAEAASLATSRLMADMSREIRAPMADVLGTAGLLLETTLAPRQRQFARTLRSSAEAMMHLLDDILDFSRIEAGCMEIERVAFDPGQLVADVASLHAEAAQRKGLELVCHIAPDAPACVWGDPQRLKQVLGKLVGNAIESTDGGEVVVSLDAADGELRLRIRDSGIGMAPEVQARLSAPSPQGDGLAVRPGTGLGLSVARQLVALMGGRIGVESQPGLGSSLHMTLPLRPAPEAAPIAALPPALTEQPVLLVEPHPLARAASLAALRRLGFRHVTTAGGEEALGLVAREPAAWGLVVYAEPGWPGQDSPLAERVRRMAPARLPRLVKLVPVAALAEPGRPALLGPHAFLPKPLAAASLRRVLLDHQPTARLVPPEPLATRREASTARVLVVEDNPVNAEIAQELLREMGCSVVLANDGEEAVALYPQQPFDLVLMDCLMPVMDGYEATRRIRAIDGGRAPRRVPIVALTASAQAVDRERCFAAGMDDHLVKPFNPALLRAAVERWAAAPLAEAPAIDGPRLLENFRFGGEVRYSTARRVIHLYFGEVPKLLQAASDGLATGDVRGVERAMHTLKSSSATVAAEQLAQLARTAELDAGAGRLGTLPGLLQSMSRQFERAARELQVRLDGFPQDRAATARPA